MGIIDKLTERLKQGAAERGEAMIDGARKLAEAAPTYNDDGTLSDASRNRYLADNAPKPMPGPTPTPVASRPLYGPVKWTPPPQPQPMPVPAPVAPPSLYGPIPQAPLPPQQGYTGTWQEDPQGFKENVIDFAQRVETGQLYDMPENDLAGYLASGLKNFGLEIMSTGKAADEFMNPFNEGGLGERAAGLYEGTARMFGLYLSRNPAMFAYNFAVKPDIQQGLDRWQPQSLVGEYMKPILQVLPELPNYYKGKAALDSARIFDTTNRYLSFINKQVITPFLAITAVTKGQDIEAAAKYTAADLVAEAVTSILPMGKLVKPVLFGAMGELVDTHLRERDFREMDEYYASVSDPRERAHYIANREKLYRERVIADRATNIGFTTLMAISSISNPRERADIIRSLKIDYEATQKAGQKLWEKLTPQGQEYVVNMFGYYDGKRMLHAIGESGKEFYKERRLLNQNDDFEWGEQKPQESSLFDDEPEAKTIPWYFQPENRGNPEAVKAYLRDESKRQQESITKGEGYVVNLDALRESFPDYTPEKSSSFRKDAERFYWPLLEQAIESDTTGIMRFTAGGPGSGKTEVAIKPLKGEPGLILDSTFSTPDKLDVVDRARKAGKKVILYAVYTPFPDALTFARSRDIRDVSDETMVKRHVDYRELMVKTAEKYRNNEIEFVILENGIDKKPDPKKVSSKVFLAYAKDNIYTKDELIQYVDEANRLETSNDNAQGRDTARGNEGGADRQQRVAEGSTGLSGTARTASEPSGSARQLAWERIPFNAIISDPAYQPRMDAFAEETAKKIAREGYNEEAWKKQDYEVWEKEPGKFFVLGGHSRTEGGKRRQATVGDMPEKVPAKVHRGITEQQARDIAARGNQSSVNQSVLDNAKSIYEARQDGREMPVHPGNILKGFTPDDYARAWKQFVVDDNPAREAVRSGLIPNEEVLFFSREGEAMRLSSELTAKIAGGIYEREGSVSRAAFMRRAQIIRSIKEAASRDKNLMSLFGDDELAKMETVALEKIEDLTQILKKKQREAKKTREAFEHVAGKSALTDEQTRILEDHRRQEIEITDEIAETFKATVQAFAERQQTIFDAPLEDGETTQADTEPAPQPKLPPLTTEQKITHLHQMNFTGSRPKPDAKGRRVVQGTYNPKFKAEDIIQLEEDGIATFEILDVPDGQNIKNTFALQGNKAKTYRPFIWPFVRESLRSGKDTYIDVNAGSAAVVKMIPEMVAEGAKDIHLNFFDSEKFIVEKALQDGRIAEIKDMITAMDDTLRTRLIDKLAEADLNEASPEVRTIMNKYRNEVPDGKFDEGFIKWYDEALLDGEKLPLPVPKSKFYDAFRLAINDAIEEVLPKREFTDLESIIEKTYRETVLVRGTGQGFIGAGGFAAKTETVKTLLDALDEDHAAYRKAMERGATVTLHSEDGKKFVAQMADMLKGDGREGKAVMYTDPPYMQTTLEYIHNQKNPDELKALEEYTTAEGIIDIYRPFLDLTGDGGSDFIMTNDINAELTKRLVENGSFNPTVYAYKEHTTPTSLHTTHQGAEHTAGLGERYATKERYRSVPGYVPERGRLADKPEEVNEIFDIAKEKGIAPSTVNAIKRLVGVSEWRKADPEQIQKIREKVEAMKENDNLLSPKEREGAAAVYQRLFGEELDPLTTKSEWRKLTGEGDILANRFNLGNTEGKGLISRFFGRFRAPLALIPTLDIKQESKLIRTIVDQADKRLHEGRQRVSQIMEQFDALLEEAEKSVPRTAKERALGINTRIFRALEGKDHMPDGTPLKLTRREQNAVRYLRSLFEGAAGQMQLDKRREQYVTHIQRPLMEAIIEKGSITGAVDELLRTGELGKIDNHLMLAMEHIFSTQKFFRYAQERKGGIVPTKNLRRIVLEYMRLVETKKALDKTLPEVFVAKRISLEGHTAKWLQDWAENLSGRNILHSIETGRAKSWFKGANRIINILYITKLGFRTLSAAKNLAGGEANALIWQDFGKYAKGKARFFGKPQHAYAIISKNEVMGGNFFDYIRDRSTLGKAGKVFDAFAWGQQRAVEYEIRGSFYLGELTKEEWQSGEVTFERHREIMDEVARTQGIYTDVDSPLAAQTTAGRAGLQFGRWMVTNAMMARRIANDLTAGKDIQRNIKRLTLAVSAHVAAVTLAAELMMGSSQDEEEREWHENPKFRKALSDIAKASGDFLGSLRSLVTGKFFVDAVKNNPLITTLDELSFTLQDLLFRMGAGPDPKKTDWAGTGITDTYLSPIQQLKDFGLISSEDTDEKLKDKQVEMYREAIGEAVASGDYEEAKALYGQGIGNAIFDKNKKNEVASAIEKRYGFDKLSEAFEYAILTDKMSEAEQRIYLETSSPNRQEELLKWNHADQYPQIDEFELGTLLGKERATEAQLMSHYYKVNALQLARQGKTVGQAFVDAVKGAKEQLREAYPGANDFQIVLIEIRNNRDIGMLQAEDVEEVLKQFKYDGEYQFIKDITDHRKLPVEEFESLLYSL